MQVDIGEEEGTIAASAARETTTYISQKNKSPGRNSYLGSPDQGKVPTSWL
jgi:hypothetical protein